MSASATNLLDRLAGRRLLLTGATGFVGAALLERLLTVVPQARPVLLVRAQPGRSAPERVVQLLDKPAFRHLRTPGVTATDLLARVEVIEGDLAQPLELPGDLDVVVHCASEVSFDPPIDEGFRANVVGTLRLLEALATSGSRPHYVHVSTAYVAGRRRGVRLEEPLDHHIDWVAELDAALRLHPAAEDASRKSAQLRHFQAEAERDHRRSGEHSVAEDAERRRRDWVRQELVAAGRERAHSLGWTDCYTFTKALGERAVEETAGALPVSIVRPSIIESALRTPYPGWIEGFKMAEPLILAFGRGELPEFPGGPDTLLDIVPVDIVVNALLAVAATAPPAGARRYFQVSSGVRNPITFGKLYEAVRDYFRDHPLEQRDRGAISVPTWHFPGGDRVEGMLRRAEWAHGVADRLVGQLPRSARMRESVRAVDRQQGRLRFLRRYLDLYRPYAEAELFFDDTNTLALCRSLSEEERAAVDFDVLAIDWRYYLQDLHCPSITAMLRPATPRRASRERPREELPVREDVLAVFDLEGTVLTSTVVETLLWLRVADATSALGAAREVADVALGTPRLLLADRRDRGVMLREVYRRYAGTSPAELDRLVDEEVAERILARLSAAALRRIRAHRAAGHRTVLITGAVRALTRPLGPLFDEVVAADLEVRDGRCTGFLAAPPPVADSRAAWLRHYARGHGSDLTASYGYADSASDLPLLRTVGHPVAVNPDATLTRVARRSRWPIEHWQPGAVRPVERVR